MSESGKLAPPIPVPNEMCSFFFSAQDKRALALVYSLAAQDAVLDRQVDEMGLGR
jgi:hypothetical protein